jgi:hypothetical protein
MSENSFTDSLGAIDRIYAGRAEVEVGEDGSVPHIDVPNENQDGPLVDLENVGVPTDTVVEEEPAEEPEPPVDPETPADPDDLTEEELEAATAPEGDV